MANGTGRLFSSEEENDLLRLAGRLPTAAGDVDLGLRGSGQLGQEEPAPATFEEAFLQGANIGPEAGQIPFEDVVEAGGVEGIREQARIQRPVIRELNELAETLLGETTGTQRAQGRINLSPFQKGALFVSDILAVANGRTMPSVELQALDNRALSLQDQANRQAFIQGLPAIKEFADMLSPLSVENRQAIAAQQIPRLEKTFGEGFGTIAFALASRPTAPEAFKAFMENPDNFDDGPTASLMRLVAFNVGYGDMQSAVNLFADMGIKGGIIENEAQMKAPVLVMKKMDGFLEELRRLGDDESREFANRLEQGKRITPTELIHFNQMLPQNSPYRFDGASIRALRDNPWLFAADLPGMVTPKQQQKYQELLNAGELSAGANYIAPSGHPDEGTMVTAPQTSAKARQLQRDGYVLLDRNTALGGGGFETPTISEINTVRQEFLKQSEPFQKLDSMYQKIVAMMPLNTPASDVSMIFAYMKILDPTSVVREGEQATASEAGKVPDKILRAYNNSVMAVKTGGGRSFDAGQKEDFFEAATALWETELQKQFDREDNYTELSELMNLADHRLIVRDVIGGSRFLSPDDVPREVGSRFERRQQERQRRTAKPRPPEEAVNRALKEANGDPAKALSILSADYDVSGLP